MSSTQPSEWSDHEIDLLRRLGVNVRQRRVELEFSQQALANAADLHRTFVTRLEKGTVNVSLINLARVARALQCTVIDLLRGL